MQRRMNRLIGNSRDNLTADGPAVTIPKKRDADARLKIDHQPGWFYYTYSLTHQRTGTVLASGKVTAWDGKVACDKIADEVIKRIKKFRPVPAKKKENS
jgi:hypothetical protein